MAPLFDNLLTLFALASAGTSLACAYVATRVAKSLRRALRQVDRIALCEESIESLRDTLGTLAARDRMRQVRAAARPKAGAEPDPFRDPEGYRRFLEEKHRDTLAALRTTKSKAN